MLTYYIIARLNGVAPHPDGTPAGGSSELLDPEEVMRAAQADFARGSYDLAVEGYEQFADEFPASALLDDALYGVGESRFAQGRFEQAMAAYDRALALQPPGDKAPDAAYRKGLALLELNRTADGIVQLQHVRDAWPDSAAARLSRAKLQSLGLM